MVASSPNFAHLSEFAKEYADDDFCARLMRKYNGDVGKCASRMKQALQWRDQKRELISSRDFLVGCDERVIGADLAQRPVVYLCMKNQMFSGAKCLDQKAVTMLQAVENMPEGVHKTVHIWDLHGQAFRVSDLNPTPLVRMLQVQESYFAERLHEVVIVGMPRMATVLKDALWPTVPEATKDKVRFLSYEGAQEYLPQVCDAEVSDRILAAMAQNRDDAVSLEERRRSWQRVDATGALVPLVGHT